MEKKLFLWLGLFRVKYYRLVTISLCFNFSKVTFDVIIVSLVRTLFCDNGINSIKDCSILVARGISKSNLKFRYLRTIQ